MSGAADVAAPAAVRAWHVDCKAGHPPRAFNDTNIVAREIPWRVAELMFDNPTIGAEILDMWDAKRALPEGGK